MPASRRLRRIAAAALLGLLLGAGPAQARGLDTVVQDDANLLHRPESEVLASMTRLAALGVDRVRLTANWAVLTRDPDSETQPRFDAADPAAYEQARWAGIDRAVIAAQATGLKVLIDVGFWAPHWATDDPPGPRARTNVDPAAYAAFVRATLLRYSGTFALPTKTTPAPPSSQDDLLLQGTFGPAPSSESSSSFTVAGDPLPRVEQFALWNEPNHPALLLPQWTGSGRGARPASPTVYRRMLAAAVPAARAVRPDAELLVGNTSSSGGTPGTGAVAPLRFLRELACVDRRLKPLRTPACANYRPIDGDGWAHHPYNRNVRPDTPADPRRPDDVSVAQLGKLGLLLDRLARRGRIAPGLKRIHVTEFGYETIPIPRRPRISKLTQARWLTWAEQIASHQRGVVSWAQFLLRDQPPAPVRVSDSTARPFGQFGTGLDEADGTPKLAALSFVAGLFAQPSGRRNVSVYVRLRLGDDPRTVGIEERRGKRWRTVATRPARGGPPTRRFVMRGQVARTRILPRRTGSRYRIAIKRAGDAAFRSLDVGLVRPLRGPSSHPGPGTG